MFELHRDFDLELRKGTPVFHKDCVLELSSGEQVPCDSAPVYHGKVAGKDLDVTVYSCTVVPSCTMCTGL